MLKRYFLSRLKESTAWIGVFVILSTLFLPHTVTIIFGVILILTPDAQLHSVIQEINDEIESKLD